MNTRGCYVVVDSWDPEFYCMREVHQLFDTEDLKGVCARTQDKIDRDARLFNTKHPGL